MPLRLTRCLCYLIMCLLLATLAPLQTWAQENSLVYYPLTLPGPAQLDNLDTLMVYGDFIDIRISPSNDAAQILWAAQELPQTDSAGGLVPVESEILSPSLNIANSALIIRAQSERSRYSLNIALPATWHYQLRVYGAGDIEATGISGDLTAWSARGHITVLEQAGRVSLTAMDGVARAQLLEGAFTGSSAITMNHGVADNDTLVVALPESTRATIRIQARGALNSDIPSLQNEQASVVESDLSQYLEMKLNGGGAALTLRNLQGDVQVLRALPE